MSSGDRLVVVLETSIMHDVATAGGYWALHGTVLGPAFTETLKIDRDLFPFGVETSELVVVRSGNTERTNVFDRTIQVIWNGKQFSYKILVRCIGLSQDMCIGNH